MLSDEEKEAKLELNRYIYGKNLSKDEIADYLSIIFGLIEKQSKEIEELKDKYSDEKIRNTIIKRYRQVIEKDYVSKDKIKAKIIEIKNRLVKDEFITASQGKLNTIIDMQSLLDKE